MSTPETFEQFLQEYNKFGRIKDQNLEQRFFETVAEDLNLEQALSLRLDAENNVILDPDAKYDFSQVSMNQCLAFLTVSQSIKNTQGHIAKPTPEPKLKTEAEEQQEQQLREAYEEMFENHPFGLNLEAGAENNEVNNNEVVDKANELTNKLRNRPDMKPGQTPTLKPFGA